MSQVFFFLLSPSGSFSSLPISWTGFPPNCLLWTCMWAPLPLCSLDPLHRFVSLVWPKISTAFCLPPSCWASLSSLPPPQLHDQASHYFCQDLVFPSLFKHPGDLALHLLPGWRSLDRLISPTRGAVGKAPAEGSTERCSSPAWCCILSPGRQSSWPWLWVTSEQKVW